MATVVWIGQVQYTNTSEESSGSFKNQVGVLSDSFFIVIVIINSRFLEHPQKWNRGNQLIHRRLTRTKSIRSGQHPETRESGTQTVRRLWRMVFGVRGIQHRLKNELVRAARHSNNLSNHMKLTIKPLATSLGRAHANGCNLLISTVLPYCSTGRWKDQWKCTHGDWNRRRWNAKTNSTKKKARILWTCYAIRWTGKKNDAGTRRRKEEKRTTAGNCRLYRDKTLKWMRSGLFSQWSDLRTGVMWWCLGVLVTARASEFWMSWRRCIWVESRLRKRELQ